MQLSLLCVSGRGSRMPLTVTLPLQLLLVASLVNMVPCLAELRARDPDVAEGRAAGALGLGQWRVPHGHHDPGRVPQSHAGTSARPLLPSRGSSHQPARTGNWCAFVHRRVLTVAVLCTTEKFLGRSVTPCPSNDPDCQVTKCGTSPRPAYRQERRILTALHWTCCPGHRGSNCQETVNPTSGERQDSEETGEDNMDVSGVEDTGERLEADLLEGAGWEKSPDQQASPGLFGIGGVMRPSTPLPLMDSASLLTVHQGFAAMMTQLQPVLDAFNRSLERLSSEMQAMSMDLQKLRQDKENTLHSRPANRGTIEEKLADSFEQIRQLQAQLNAQEKLTEQTVQTQKAQLQHNLTSLKEDIDHQINQSHEDIQGSLQSVIASVEEIRRSQERLEGVKQEQGPGGHPGLGSRVWDAISNLDGKVLNNTMQLGTLSEDSRRFDSFTQDLELGLQNLSQVLEQISQSSEVHFAETGLEVEAIRMAALNSIDEVTVNLSMQTKQLRELELYVDNFYQHFQSNEPSTTEEACSCKEISNSLVRLEQELANVTDLTRENRYALEDVEAKKGQDDWPMELEDLHQGLLSVKESLAYEQAKSRRLGDSVSHLKDLLLGSQQEILQLKESAVAKSAKIRHLSASFSSLLKDAVRHSEVLEVLLGDEVIEFLSWPSSQKQELSIPFLLQRMRLLQEKTESHESRLASVRRSSKDRDHMTHGDPDAFSEWIKEQGSVAADQRDSFAGDFAREGDNTASDMWSLDQRVEELASRLTKLEEQCHNCTAAPSGIIVELQKEVTSLRQALGDHLRIFQNLFSYTEELSSSPRSLNLDRLWTVINGEDRKRKDKREASSRLHKACKPRGPSLSSVAFIAGLDGRTSGRGRLLFEKVTLNHGNAYSPSSGEFVAPQTGVYLFLTTLDCDTGPCLAHMMHDAIPVATFRQERSQGGPQSRALLLELSQGDSVTLELVQGTLDQGQPDENTLSGLLLVGTEHPDCIQN